MPSNSGYSTHQTTTLRMSKAAGSSRQQIRGQELTRDVKRTEGAVVQRTRDHRLEWRARFGPCLQGCGVRTGGNADADIASSSRGPAATSRSSARGASTGGGKPAGKGMVCTMIKPFL
jgi:hypothetical protein